MKTEKKIYKQPKLTTIGKFSKLTQSGGSVAGDGQGTQKVKTPLAQ